MSKYHDLIAKLMDFAKECDEIIAVIMIGSQSRKEAPADDYSDLDIIAVVNTPSYFLTDDTWIACMGDFGISFVEDTITGDKERRILFRNGLDVDFVFITYSTARTALKSSEGKMILQKGYRVLIDKADLTNCLPVVSIPTYLFPTSDEFNNHINDFWYHTVWTVKKLLRGEIWAAKFCVDSYMKYKLLWMMELQSRAKNGLDYDTWFNGRFVDTWASAEALGGLKSTFAHYNYNDIKLALFRTIDLYHEIALDAAKRINYVYPIDVENCAKECIERLLEFH